MNNTANLKIGVLSITATILLVGLLLSLSWHDNQAHAIGQIDRGGDYLMMTGQFTENSELIYITDAAALRMNSYSWEPPTNELKFWDSIDLSQFRGGKRQR